MTRRHGKRMKPLGGPRDPRHGTRGAYDYWGCRCNKCLDANTEDQKKWREQAEIIEHGESGYARGCRCKICKKCRLEAQRARTRQKKLYKASHPAAKVITTGVGGLA